MLQLQSLSSCPTCHLTERPHEASQGTAGSSPALTAQPFPTRSEAESGRHCLHYTELPPGQPKPHSSEQAACLLIRLCGATKVRSRSRLLQARLQGSSRPPWACVHCGLTSCSVAPPALSPLSSSVDPDFSSPAFQPQFSK